MKVVVTGGAGFIGSHVVRACLEAPEISEVVVVDDLSTGTLDNLVDLPARLVRGTVLDPALLDEAFEGARTIVHLAAVPSVPRSLHDPFRSHHANATGTLTVLDAGRRHGVQQVVVASSSSVYGDNVAMPKHEALRPKPLSPYAVSKLAAESYALAYTSCFGLPVLPLRFFNVYGPGQPAGHSYAAVVPAFILAALEDRPLRVFGDGHQTRDLTFVGSVAAVVVDAVLRGVCTTDAVNLAFGKPVSVLRLISVLQKILGRRLDVIHEPARQGDVRHSHADNRRLRASFPGIRPVPLRLGLERTIAWMSAPRPASKTQPHKGDSAPDGQRLFAPA